MINADIFYVYNDKVLILKCSLFLSNRNTEIWSKERSMGPRVAKMCASRQMKVSGSTGLWYKNI